MKTLKLDEATHQKLSIYKAQHNLKTLNDAVAKLLEGSERKP
jgi:macrodomain Ter protein organizer (MatP/YcbG family)